MKLDVLLTSTSGLPLDDARFAKMIVESKFGESFAVRLNDSTIAPPMEGYNEERKQYSAEVFLPLAERLLTKCGCFTSMVLTDVDVFAKFTNFVFGLADMVHRVAVVSSCRIHPSFWGMKETRESFEVQWGKVVTHEFGHTLGISHCEDWNCVMKYSNSPDELHRKGKEFCGKCAKEVEREIARLKR